MFDHDIVLIADDIYEAIEANKERYDNASISSDEYDKTKKFLRESLYKAMEYQRAKENIKVVGKRNLEPVQGFFIDSIKTEHGDMPIFYDPKLPKDHFEFRNKE